MGDAQFLRMQLQSRCHCLGFGMGIEPVTEDRVAQCQHVYAQLVRAAGDRRQFYPRAAIGIARQHQILCLRRFAGFEAYLLQRPVRPVANQR
ncbi:hypothetical protein D3C79_1032160 [compost metagenome]